MKYALALLLIPGVALAEDAPSPEQPTIVYVDKPAIIVTKDGTAMTELPPGFFLPEPAFYAVDAELRRLQMGEVKLKAENERLREAVDTIPVLPFIIAGAVGLAVGGAVVYFAVPR